MLVGGTLAPGSKSCISPEPEVRRPSFFWRPAVSQGCLGRRKTRRSPSYAGPCRKVVVPASQTDCMSRMGHADAFDLGVSLLVATPHRFDMPVRLDELSPSPAPPQSFAYLPADALGQALDAGDTFSDNHWFDSVAGGALSPVRWFGDLVHAARERLASAVVLGLTGDAEHIDVAMPWISWAQWCPTARMIAVSARMADGAIALPRLRPWPWPTRVTHPPSTASGGLCQGRL